MIHHLDIFDAIIQRRFSVIPKITIGNLCKLFHDVIFVTFSVSSLSLITFEKDGKSFTLNKKRFTLNKKHVT